MRLQVRMRSHFKLRPSTGHGARWQTSSADDAWATREGAGDVNLDGKEKDEYEPAQTSVERGCTPLVRVLASSTHRCTQCTVPAHCIP
jgi:hypothetical protein